MNFDNYKVPDHAQETLKNYLTRGWSPGGFVESMMAMDMQRAVYAADHINRAYMADIARWIIENAPRESWGSYEQVDAWCKDINERRTKWVTWYHLNNKETDQDLSF